MTIATLDAALSGLRAAQRSLDTISSNISNASTEGYTRKILPQETLMIDGRGVGVELKAVKRIVDESLLRDVFGQISVTEGLSVRDTYLTRIQDFYGASETDQSIAATVSGLADSFIELSNAPNDSISLSSTLDSAVLTAARFNDLSNLINQLRNQADSEIAANVAVVNDILDRIATLNVQINTLSGSGDASADLQDQRDTLIRELSGYIEISTYTSDNGKIVVTTKQGHLLADETPHALFFENSNLLPTSVYPTGASGLYVDSASGADLTTLSFSGRIGELLKLRDETLPTYQAQIDELAQKLSTRLDEQGLRLFTDPNGDIPANVADPGLVSYVGYASLIQVNTDILNDPTLLRSGTNGNTVQDGSNEVIRKVIQFAFGAYSHQEAQGNVDISAGTLFASTGMQATSQYIGNVNIGSYTTLDAHPDITAGTNFDLDIGGVTQTITINAGDTATDLVNSINAAFGAGTASLNSLGQLRIDANQDITFTDNTLGGAGAAALGITYGVTTAEIPSFTIAVGAGTPIHISIGAADTSATLLANLNAISGITASLNGSGELVIIPNEGGDITLVDGIGNPLAAMGVSVSNITHTAFRQNNLGPAGDLSTGLLSNSTLESYARSAVATQSEDAYNTQDKLAEDQAYLSLLENRFLDQSGVNLDQEMAELIRIQSQFSAAARMISAAEEMLNEILEAFR